MYDWVSDLIVCIFDVQAPITGVNVTQQSQHTRINASAPGESAVKLIIHTVQVWKQSGFCIKDVGSLHV